MHRIGRTGRAGRHGEAVTFLTPKEKRKLRQIERLTGTRLEEITLPSPADVSSHRAGKLLERAATRHERGRLAMYTDLVNAKAAELGIDAVHLGEDDGDIEEARRALGPGSLIGVSCYASVERARALAPVADYLAFGALFASGTKPLARPAPLSVFREVQALSLARPLVGIGGIDADNIGSVLAAGADAAAVIGSLFRQGDVRAAAQRLVAAAARP